VFRQASKKTQVKTRELFKYMCKQKISFIDEMSFQSSRIHEIFLTNLSAFLLNQKLAKNSWKNVWLASFSKTHSIQNQGKNSRFLLIWRNPINQRIFLKDVYDYALKHGWFKNTPLRPGEIVVILNKDLPMFETFGRVALLMLVGSEVFCIILFYMILRIMKQNSHIFSQKTYRLHLQFTLLLGAQVSHLKGSEMKARKAKN
jgi:hypothetical protein